MYVPFFLYVQADMYHKYLSRSKVALQITFSVYNSRKIRKAKLLSKCYFFCMFSVLNVTLCLYVYPENTHFPSIGSEKPPPPPPQKM